MSSPSPSIEIFHSHHEHQQKVFPMTRNLLPVVRRIRVLLTHLSIEQRWTAIWKNGRLMKHDSESKGVKISFFSSEGIVIRMKKNRMRVIYKGFVQEHAAAYEYDISQPTDFKTQFYDALNIHMQFEASKDNQPNCTFYPFRDLKTVQTTKPEAPPPYQLRIRRLKTINSIEPIHPSLPSIQLMPQRPKHA